MKTYIIAEIGINHNGGLENCFKLIDAAANAGCNGAKFQLFKAARLYPCSAGKLSWQKNKKKYSYNIYNTVKSFELPQQWVMHLMRRCKQKRIDFLSSVFDKESASLLIRHGIGMIKIASSDITNLPLIEYCARYKLPMVISTGGATHREVEEAVNTVTKFHNQLSLLHCSLKYPTKLSECNLGAIKTLHFYFSGLKIGYSDHTQEVSTVAVQAVYLGARIIEKHITLDKRMKGPDHFFALEPEELRQMVRDIGQAELDYKNKNFTINNIVYGSSEKKPYPCERYLRGFVFTKLFAKRDIKKGQLIRVSDISILRPGQKKDGLEPKFLRLFQEYKITAKKDIAFEDPITWGSIFP